MEERYRRAESLLQWRQRKMVLNADVLPRWIGSSDRFWYVRETPAGHEIRVVDASSGDNRPAFDHQVFVHALSAALEMDASLDDPQIYAYDLRNEPLRLRFKAYGRSWEYDPPLELLLEIAEESELPVRAPNGSMFAYTKNHNIWMCDSGSVDRALTTDGVHLYAFATPPDAHRPSGRFKLSLEPGAVWSFDSSRLLTLPHPTTGWSGSCPQ